MKLLFFILIAVATSGINALPNIDSNQQNC